MAKGRTRLRVLRNSVPPEPEERFPRSTNCIAGARLRPAVLEWLRRRRWENQGRLSPRFRRRALKQQGLHADEKVRLIQLDTRGRQNHDARGDELLSLGTIIDGRLRPDCEFALNLRVGVDDEFEFIGIMVAI